jgi:hypothetical protein
MADSPDLVRLLDQVTAAWRQRAPCGDWVSAFAGGDAIGTDAAGFIANCSAQTIRRHATDAALTEKPIGVWFAQSVWLISLARLLDKIEATQGLPARLAAQSRAEKYVALRAPLQTSLPCERAATS